LTTPPIFKNEPQSYAPKLPSWNQDGGFCAATNREYSQRQGRRIKAMDNIG
jgi:hypothetical protein